MDLGKIFSTLAVIILLLLLYALSSIKILAEWDPAICSMKRL